MSQPSAEDVTTGAAAWLPTPTDPPAMEIAPPTAKNPRVAERRNANRRMRRRANRGRGRSAMVVAGCALRGNEVLLHGVEFETHVGQSGAGGDLRAVGDLAWPAS